MPASGTVANWHLGIWAASIRIRAGGLSRSASPTSTSTGTRMVSSRANVIGSRGCCPGPWVPSGRLPRSISIQRRVPSGLVPPIQRPEFTQLNREPLNFRWPEPVLHFEIFWILHAADAVGDHEAADPLRVLHRVVQPTDPAGRCRHDVEAIKAQVLHQAVQVIAHGTRLLPPSNQAASGPSCAGRRQCNGSLLR